MNQLSFYKSVLRSGLIVGILDGMAACVNAYLARGVMPSAVFRYVASGAFGSSAFSGSTLMVVYGLLFHLTIAMGWTFLFYWASTKMKLLTNHKIVAGLGYGIFVWLMMNLMVLPLSNIPPITYRLAPTLIMIGIHMVVIGLSISLLANRYFAKKR